MKQKLLTLGMLAWATVICPLSACAWTFDFETLTSISEYEGKYAPVSTPSAFGADGVVYQTGLYDGLVMIGDDMLENVATSAYIAAVSPGLPSAFAKWAVGIKGAAKISRRRAASAGSLENRKRVSAILPTTVFSILPSAFSVTSAV